MNEANETAHEDFPQAVQPLHERLLAEGTTWRDHLPFTASETVPKLLHAVRQEMAAQDISASDAHIHQGAMDMTTPSISPTAVPTTSAKMQRRKRMIISGALAALLVSVGVVGFYLAQPPKIQSFLAPPFHWSARNVTTTMTPQQAFANGLTLLFCGSQQTTAFNVAWLATNANYGVALILGHCLTRPNSRFLFLFEVSKERMGYWEPEPISADGWPETIPLKEATEVPTWLPLPSDRYSSFITEGTAQKPGVFTRGWLSGPIFFLGGTIADQAIRPSDSNSIILTGQAGWMAQQYGLTIIIVPHSETQTYFFVGNFSAQQTQSLANVMLVHVAEWPALT